MSDVSSLLRFISKGRIEKDMRYLCEEIGTRFVGTAGERRAAEWIANRFRNLGLSNVHFEEFQVEAWNYEIAKFSLTKPRRRDVACWPVSYTGSTADGGVEAPLVYIETGTPLDLAKVETKGKIGVMWGSIGGSHAPHEGVEKFRRLLNAGFDGLVMVEDRVSTAWPRMEGIPPYWFKFGTMPMVSISFQDGRLMYKQKASRGHLEVKASRLTVSSENVVGEIPGEVYGDEVIIICGHHDTVPDSVGAGDNASAVANVMELARVLRRAKPKRTIRFITFGSEEQLSMGAVNYVTGNKSEMEKIVLVLNMDDVSMPIGRSRILVTGPKELESYVTIATTEVGYSADVSSGVSPFSDHYAFTVYGVPTVYFQGKHTAVFFYHSKFDRPDMMSFEDTANVAKALAHIAIKVANLDVLPFGREIPEEFQQETEWCKKELYGLE